MTVTIAEAVVNVRINTAPFTKGMTDVRSNLNKSMTQWNKTFVQFNRNFSKVTAPILMAAKAYMAAITAFSTKALHALYSSNTIEGRAWKKTFDTFRARLNSEMARIGTLLLKTPIFGKTPIAWMDKLISTLRTLDLSKVKELAKWFERALISITAIRSITMFGRLAAGLTDIGKMFGKAGGNTELLKEMKALKKGQYIEAAATGGGFLGIAERMGMFKSLVSNLSGSFSNFTTAFKNILSDFGLTHKNILFKFLNGLRVIYRMESGKLTLRNSMGPGIPIITSWTALKNSVTALLSPFTKLLGVTIALAAGLGVIQGLASSFGFIVPELIDVLKWFWWGLKAGLSAIEGVLALFVMVVRNLIEEIGAVIRSIIHPTQASKIFKDLNADIDRQMKAWDKKYLSTIPDETEKERKLKEFIPPVKLGGSFIGLTEGVKTAQEWQKETIKLDRERNKSLERIHREQLETNKILKGKQVA